MLKTDFEKYFPRKFHLQNLLCVSLRKSNKKCAKLQKHVKNKQNHWFLTSFGGKIFFQNHFSTSQNQKNNGYFLKCFRICARRPILMLQSDLRTFKTQ